jgi:hypothetical protein
MKKAEKNIIGRWRITKMETWDTDYVDMEVPAHITIKENLAGHFQFGLVQGQIDARAHIREDTVRVEFSWDGNSECDPADGSRSQAMPQWVTCSCISARTQRLPPNAYRPGRNRSRGKKYKSWRPE